MNEGVDLDGVRPGLRERKQARTRLELKAVADRLFDRFGFDHVTVDDICAEADVSPRTFFRYFHNKGDIVFSGLQPRFDQVTSELAVRPAGEPAFQALGQAIVGVFGDPDYEREAARIHRQICGSPELMGASLATYRTFLDRLVDLVVDRPPCDGDGRRARLLVGVALVALETAVEQWADDPDHPLRAEVAARLGQVAGVTDTL